VRTDRVAVDYHRDDERRRIVATSIGQVSVDDTLGVIDRQANDGAWSYGFLWDLRGSEDIPTAADLRRIVLHVADLTMKYGPRGPVAFVVLDAVLSRVTRQYGRMAKLTAFNVRVFTTMEEAERWLEKDA